MSKGDEVAEEAMQRVQTDIEEGFRVSFSRRSDATFAFELHDGEELNATPPVATSERLVAVPWVYPCTHTGPFLNIPATFVKLDLRGTTIVDIRAAPADWSYYRYVDYVGALHQMGVSTAVRPALNEDEYANWLNNR